MKSKKQHAIQRSLDEAQEEASLKTKVFFLNLEFKIRLPCSTRSPQLQKVTKQGFRSPDFGRGTRSRKSAGALIGQVFVLPARVAAHIGLADPTSPLGEARDPEPRYSAPETRASPARPPPARPPPALTRNPSSRSTVGLPLPRGPAQASADWLLGCARGGGADPESERDAQCARARDGRDGCARPARGSWRRALSVEAACAPVCGPPGLRAPEGLHRGQR